MATFEQYEKKDKTKAWKFQAYLGINEVTGKPVKTTRRNFKTKKEAQLALSRLKLEFENKETKKIVTETYQEIYDLWFSSYKKNGKRNNQFSYRTLYEASCTSYIRYKQNRPYNP
ncbi:MAG: Arm DNA-binding domain-containing protein [Enterococcus hirae]|nr:Arm DNA-binding domain-containing protein [Enterococcus hirae]